MHVSMQLGACCKFCENRKNGNVGGVELMRGCDPALRLFSTLKMLPNHLDEFNTLCFIYSLFYILSVLYTLCFI
jgi:hypothetical protein